MSDSRRLFFALWLTDRQRESLRDIVQPVLSSIEGDFVDRRNWHVTLVFIGDFPGHKVAQLQASVADIAVDPFRLRFDRATFWARPKIACLETAIIPDELGRLVGQIREAVEPFGISDEEHSYRPHITIARRARSFATQRLARAVELQCSDFALVESVSVQGGVQYHPLKQ
ncbi:MAG: RNA 2',3'-cyclic phosphodiesterase [Gammaproteobacteria bacterium]|nr:RNA 2',3'-cyclic phosphodiesterase [Gammaproteobacteria bacterium]